MGGQAGEREKRIHQLQVGRCLPRCRCSHWWLCIDIGASGFDGIAMACMAWHIWLTTAEFCCVRAYCPMGIPCKQRYARMAVVVVLDGSDMRAVLVVA